jgi:peptide/nickel transport system permease protein
MLKFLFSRLAGMLAVMSLVGVIVFGLTRVAAGDPVSVLLGDQATPADVERAKVRYGLDQPVAVQFAVWVGQVARGDLGDSIFLQRPVTQALLERAEPTLWLAFLAVALAALIGVPAGIASAVFRGGPLDQFLSTVAMLGASIPSFWLGLLMMQAFAVSLGWFPVSGYGEPGAALAERLRHLVLPAAVLGLLNSTLVLRFTRAAMMEVMTEDYIRTARSKGLGETVVVLKHALRNALVPIVTVIGLTVALMIGGAVVTETVFGLPGVGSLVVNAVMRRDYPVIQGALLVVAGLYVLINFLVDLLYAVVDPRVRL